MSSWLIVRHSLGPRVTPIWLRSFSMGSVSMLIIQT
jgi:hypothetical protein